MDILFLSPWYPYPPTNGSKLRIYNLLRGLCAHHNVTLLSFADGDHTAVDKPALSSLCRKVIVIPKEPYNPVSLRAISSYVNPMPRSLVDTYSSEMAHEIQRVLHSQPVDLVVVSELPMTPYSRLFEGLPCLLEDLELGAPFDKATSAATRWLRFRHGLTWTKLRKYLGRCLRQYDACTVVSTREKEILHRTVPEFSSIRVIPNGLALEDYGDVSPPRRPHSIVFTGSFRYRPNYEAMLWFMGEVYPLIQKTLPCVSITVTGDQAGLSLPHDQSILFAGHVADVKTSIASHEISIVPVWEGSGTRLKLLEPMALRTPAVSTSKGAEGLEVTDGEHLLIADTSQDFADAVVRLLDDEALRNRLAQNALALVKEKYNWDAILPRFLELVEDVVSSH